LPSDRHRGFFNRQFLTISSPPSISEIGSILNINRKIELGIVGYEKNNSRLAQARAESVKNFLIQSYPAIEPSRLKVRGVGKAESVRAGSKKYTLNESITFVTRSR
jgi:hypothetical protein